MPQTHLNDRPVPQVDDAGNDSPFANILPRDYAFEKIRPHLKLFLATDRTVSDLRSSEFYRVVMRDAIANMVRVFMFNPIDNPDSYGDVDMIYIDTALDFAALAIRAVALGEATGASHDVVGVFTAASLKAAISRNLDARLVEDFTG